MRGMRFMGAGIRVGGGNGGILNYFYIVYNTFKANTIVFYN